ncbi:MAG: DNA polymerase II large subunit [Candidatus Woesearchaeota archaeon]|nr:DNA polymerase II large subunit [Candidatus Woesearchaeota archaeon]
MTAASPAMKKYFNNVEKEIKKAYDLAESARKKGYDPEERVDIPLAKNMQERVEGLISIVAPQLVGSGMIERIHELEEKYCILDWRVALIIAVEVAQEKFCNFDSKKQALEIGIRTGFAYHTLGIVAAPLEGFIELEIKKRKDGKEYLSPMYAGPIRGAGGTAAAFSVILTDYVRKKMGYESYDPTPQEIERFAVEIRDYHERVTNLQYYPSEQEIKFLIKHIPVEVGGNPTERIEVSQHKDIERIGTERIRGGVCLVVGEGLAQKAPKLWKRLSKWGDEVGLEWGFLSDFLDLQKKIKARGEVKKKYSKKISPDHTYIKDLVAGRPVLTHPLRKGGFRLRYGHSRVNGMSSSSIHPATQYVLDGYIALGTQLKTERPGKAAAVTACDSIEGPIVKLEDESVIQLNSAKKARIYKNKISEIIYLGDYLCNYGDFSENNHVLVPPGYCEEWWQKEIEKEVVDLFGTLDYDKLCNLLEISRDKLDSLLKLKEFDVDLCFKISNKTKVPLHPKFTFYWNSISTQELIPLLKWFKKVKIIKDENKIKKFVLPLQQEKLILEKLGVPHKVASKEFVVLKSDKGITLLNVLNLNDTNIDSCIKVVKENLDKSSLEIINIISSIKIRDKGGTFIGARMGRPEKSKMRKLKGSPHVLFPVGKEGGRLRSILAARDEGKITADFPIFYCKDCESETVFSVCEVCDKKTLKRYYCPECGIIEKQECEHGQASTYTRRKIDINRFLNASLKKIKFRAVPDLIKGVRGTSNKDHIPEHLIKGILRAKHEIYVNKDGTTRYDMSELAISHFKPKEIGTSIEKLRKLGYTKDITGQPLERDDQLLEIKPQDIILPGNRNTTDEPADVVLYRVSKFIDELLVKLYGEKKYYNLKKPRDIVGHLVIGLAPHISAGMIGRIIGFSKVQGCFAHPLWHAALRRDCDGDESCVILLMDSLLNFSRQFLPDKRGGRTMDAPLVLSSKLIPSEVDDMVHGVDVVWSYPLEFYNACLEYKYPYEVDIEQIADRLDTPGQYESMGFTHHTSDINMGITCSAYKTLPSMQEKLKGQMEIAKIIRAVDQRHVADLVINKHFIKDIKGNLRKFSMQQFRCVKCNSKYRRPPLSGKCRCGGKIIFTISEGSIVKYLEPSISLAKKYEVSDYLKQTLELTKRRIESIFGKDKEKQEELGKWFG